MWHVLSLLCAFQFSIRIHRVFMKQTQTEKKTKVEKKKVIFRFIYTSLVMLLWHRRGVVFNFTFFNFTFYSFRFILVALSRSRRTTQMETL